MANYPDSDAQPGGDTFIFNEMTADESDVITDFQNGLDNMRFSGVENILGTGLEGFVDALNVTAVSAMTVSLAAVISLQAAGAQTRSMVATAMTGSTPGQAMT